METDRLKQFCLILETGSLSKAAELLGISHGGLSKSMTALQSELGVSLFQAHGRGILPTDEGKSIYRRAQEVLEKVENLKRETSKTIDKKYRIGALEVFIGPLFSRAVFDDDTKFEILELNPGKIEIALQENRIDVGFTYLPVPLEGVEYLKIAKFKFGIFARKGAFKNKKIEDLPFVAPVAEAPLNPLGIKERDVWPDGLFPRKKKFEVNLLSTAMGLAHQGLCAIYIPDCLAAHHNKIVDSELRLESLPMPAELSKQDYFVYLVKRVSSQEDAMTKKLSSIIRKLCN